ncbi:MAG: hypothetical protein J6K77_06635 [Ruminococcus sp.]|nr:hypothetical protein [Ruminococcus sp.]
MNKGRLISFAAALSLAAAALPCDAAGADTHTVTVRDINGNETYITVDHGDSLDLSGIDVSAMTEHIDDYTQKGFSSWSSYPDVITEDITVQALYVQMTISCDSEPAKTEYFYDKGSIITDGLEVSITVLRQTPELNDQGEYIVTSTIVPIESKCTSIPSLADEAFAGGRTSATVYIYPPGSKRAICIYDISCFRELGDIDGNGKVDASDAAKILIMYADISTGKVDGFSEDAELRGDIDRNGKIDASDAALVLKYYAALSTSGSFLSWDDFLRK